MTTAAQNLTVLQDAYSAVVTKIAEHLANPRAAYSVDGVSYNPEAYYQMLLDREKQLREIPGVAPPDIIDLVSVGRG